MSFWKKRIKNVKELSKATGINEEKIKELKEGKREIGGETMENILNKINEINKKTKLEKNVEKKEMVDWIKSQDFQKLQEDFNFKTQKDLAIAIGVSPGTFNDCIKKPEKYNEVTTKIYKFFQNDFNKAIANVETTKKIKVKSKKSCSTKMLDYIKKTGKEEILKTCNVNSKLELCRKLGISKSSFDNMFNGYLKRDSRTVKKLYDILNSYNQEILKEETNETSISIDNQENKTSNEGEMEDNINTPINIKTPVNEPKKGELESVKSKQLEEKKKISKKELKRKNKILKKSMATLATINFDLLEEINKKTKKIAKLEKQIKRYEILIDRLK